MRRKITDQLIGWFEQSQKKPLVIFGARQTGKTTSVVDFAQSHFEHLVHIDFFRQPTMKAAFQGDLEPSKIITSLEALLNRDINPENTLIFLDEIQACDEALTSLKFFCSDAPHYHVISAGSLLGVHVARTGSFPVGYVDMLTMHPMDFEEFCWAIDKTRAFNLVRECFAAFTACPVHDDMMQTYRDYLLVGGMPEAAKRFAENGSLSEVKTIQSNIATAYVADMTKYANSIDSAKIVETWSSLPSQLAKENGSTKFMWKYVSSGAKAERYQSAVDWLIAAGLVIQCTQISEGESPLKSFEIPTSFKLYALDTGLLANEFDAQPGDFTDKGLRSAHFRGGMSENYVMQQLSASNCTAYYWGQQSTYEVDFVMRLKDGVIPIEVKSGEHTRSHSAKRFAEKYHCPYIIYISANNFGQTELTRSVPLYAACLIGELV